MALTLTGRELTDAHRIAQARTAAQWVGLLQLLTGEIDPFRIDATMPDFVAMGSILAAQAARESQGLAAGYLDAYRGAEGHPGGPIIAHDPDLTAAIQRLSVMGPLAKQRIGQGARAQEAIDQAFWQIVGGLQRDLLAPGRDLIGASTLANPASIGFRRVADLNPCAFCAMLVTRGPAYASPQTAGEGRKYHDRCGCTVEEVFDHWEPTKVEQAMIDLYEAAHQPGMSGSETAAAMRAQGQGVINDAHVPDGEKAKPGPKPGGGGGRGGIGGGGTHLPAEPPDPSDRGAWRAYWKSRQDQVPFEFHGEMLEPHEVVFAERFWAAGEMAEWIAKDPHRRPTNDFRWLRLGLPVELKHTKPRYETIHGRIVSAASKAAKHGVTKENWMVDLGDEELTNGLRRQLETFNMGREKYRARHLWVMHRGLIEAIDLQ